MPPQCVTYILGVGMQTLHVGPDLLKLLRAAWSLFDQMRIVDCKIGSVGATARLRIQMDEITGILGEKPIEDPDELELLITKKQQIIARLLILCQAVPELSQIAAPYSVSFMVERLLWGIKAVANGNNISLDPFHDLLSELEPHVHKLFRDTKCEKLHYFGC